MNFGENLGLLVIYVGIIGIFAFAEIKVAPLRALFPISSSELTTLPSGNQSQKSVFFKTHHSHPES